MYALVRQMTLDRLKRRDADQFYQLYETICDGRLVDSSTSCSGDDFDRIVRAASKDTCYLSFVMFFPSPFWHIVGE
jgi:hypothetical protein